MLLIPLNPNIAQVNFCLPFPSFPIFPPFVARSCRASAKPTGALGKSSQIAGLRELQRE